jgi:hypothetical protein
MIDREKARKKGIGYDRWAAVHNLKQMAATHNFLVENDMLDLSRLDEAVEEAAQLVAEKRSAIRDMDVQIRRLKDRRHWQGEYRRTRPIIDEGRKLSGKKLEKYREAYEADYITYEAARKFLKEAYHGNTLPNYKALNAEIEALISEKNAAYNEYDAAKEKHKELVRIRDNARKIYQDKERTPGKKKEHDHEL